MYNGSLQDVVFVVIICFLVLKYGVESCPSESLWSMAVMVHCCCLCTDMAVPPSAPREGPVPIAYEDIKMNVFRRR